MANINAPKIEYFESFAAEIIGKFQRIKSLVPNRVASGDYHEEVIKSVLRNFLSKRYSVKKGFIYAGEGKVSKQIDIMIVDENAPTAYIFQEGDFAIVLPQAVVAVMEVKTTLKAEAFDDAIDNIASAKILEEFPTTLMGIIFAYDGTTPTDQRMDNWFKRPKPSKYKENNSLTPNAIFSLTHGYLLSTFSAEGKMERGGKYYHKLFRDDSVKKSASDTAWQLSLVLAFILGACEQSEFRATRMMKQSSASGLVQYEGGMRSNKRFSFGEGLSEIT